MAVLAADQPPARREDTHRAAGPVPHPADGERPRTGACGPHPGGTGGTDAGVYAAISAASRWARP